MPCGGIVSGRFIYDSRPVCAHCVCNTFVDTRQPAELRKRIPLDVNEEFGRETFVGIVPILKFRPVRYFIQVSLIIRIIVFYWEFGVCFNNRNFPANVHNYFNAYLGAPYIVGAVRSFSFRFSDFTFSLYILHFPLLTDGTFITLFINSS